MKHLTNERIEILPSPHTLSLSTHILPVQSIESCHCIANGIDSYMAHMKVSGWIGEHGQDVELVVNIGRIEFLFHQSTVPVPFNVTFYFLCQFVMLWGKDCCITVGSSFNVPVIG